MLLYSNLSLDDVGLSEMNSAIVPSKMEKSVPEVGGGIFPLNCFVKIT